MKNLALILFFTAALLACNRSSIDSGNSPDPAEEQATLVSYKYKVADLGNSAVADSIFRLHFSLEGIDKMIISESDCTVVFTVDAQLLNDKKLREAVASQGGIIVNR
jgi:hypothetical protein